MSRYVVDTSVVLHLTAEELEVSPEHELLAPTLIRSQALSTLHEAVHAGDLTPEAAHEQLGWASTYDAEYLALTQLQADALVTLDADLARRAEAVVPLAAFGDLLA